MSKNQRLALVLSVSVLLAASPSRAGSQKGLVLVSVTVVESCNVINNQAGLNLRCSQTARPVVTTATTSPPFGDGPVSTQSNDQTIINF